MSNYKPEIIGRLIRTGEALSNLAYNLGQEGVCSHLTGQDRLKYFQQEMLCARKGWVAALADFHKNC